MDHKENIFCTRTSSKYKIIYQPKYQYSMCSLNVDRITKHCDAPCELSNNCWRNARSTSKIVAHSPTSSYPSVENYLVESCRVPSPTWPPESQHSLLHFSWWAQPAWPSRVWIFSLAGDSCPELWPFEELRTLVVEWSRSNPHENGDSFGI